MQLSSQFSEALIYAAEMHAEQKRKSTDIPYIAHLLGVASIALEHGANEEEAIAALLHDGPEDAGGKPRLEDIRLRFGHEVAEIVDGCTDTFEKEKPAWRQRKEAYVAHLPQASESIRLVSAADKLYNARAILKDYRTIGEDVWARFTGGRDGTLWYYRALVDAFKHSGADPLVQELDRVVTEIETLATI